MRLNRSGWIILGTAVIVVLGFGLVVVPRVLPASAVSNAGPSVPAVTASPLASPLAATPSATPSATPAVTASPITKAQAIAAVEAFLGRSIGPATVADAQSMAIGDTYQVEATGPDGISAYVDVHTGRVQGVLIMSAAPNSAGGKLTSDQARAAAAKFLAAHKIPTDGMTVTVTKGGQGGSYVVDWKRYQGDVLMPDQRHVVVNSATGEVYSFSDFRFDSAPVPDAAIAKDRAIQLATTAAGMTKPTVKTAELKMTSTADPNWPDRLVWSIQLSENSTGGSISAAWVYVDALTGEAKVTGRG